MSKALRFLFAIGWMMIAFGVGLLFEGDIVAGALLLLGGLVLGGLPLSIVLRSLRDIGGQDVTPSPAFADPALRGGFRRTGRLLIAFSLLPFLGAGAVMYAFWMVPHRDGASTGALVAMLLLGLVIAAVPGVLGFGLLKCGRMIAAGDVDAAGSAMRLNWIVVVLGGIATLGSLADDRPGYGTVAWVAGAITVVTLVLNVAVMWFVSSVQVFEHERGKAAAPQ